MFSLGLDRLGFWSRPRILWAGASTVPPDLTALVAALNAALAPCGYQPDPRTFQVHVTLARKAHRPPDTRDLPTIAWRVDGFCLAESVSGERGSEYRVLARWPLGVA